MKHILLFFILNCSLFVVLSGCSNRPYIPAASSTDIINNIKADFQRYEKGSPLSGSEEMTLESLIGQLRKADSSKADIAEKALNDCKALNGKPAEQKKVAAEALGKL